MFGPAVHCLNIKCNSLSPQKIIFFLVLMKLRQAKDDMEFIYMFEVGKRTIIVLPNNFMYF